MENHESMDMVVRTAVEGYDIPFKYLDLGSGMSKVLPAASASEANDTDKDSLQLCLLGKGVRRGDTFAPPIIPYKDLYRLFDQAEECTYSSKDNCFGYRSERGRFISLDQLFRSNLAYGNSCQSLAELAYKRPNAVLNVSSGIRNARIRLSQLMDGSRFYYPLLTSEQILSGVKPEESRGQKTDAGLILTAEKKLIFVIGQLNWNDITEDLFVELEVGGALVTIEDIPEERKLHNILYVGPMGAAVEEHRAYQGKGGEVTEVDVKEGELIRFNIDSNDLLNKTKMYYKFTVNYQECGEPSPQDGFVYNTRIPLYFGAGGDYPSGIVAPSPDVVKIINIRMVAFGAECPAGEPDYFRIRVVE